MYVQLSLSIVYLYSLEETLTVQATKASDRRSLNLDTSIYTVLQPMQITGLLYIPN